jgi:hypothetical protein
LHQLLIVKQQPGQQTLIIAVELTIVLTKQAIVEQTEILLLNNMVAVDL